MKSLVLAEKPSVARDIARVLKCGKSLNGAMEGQEYIVTWGLGTSCHAGGSGGLPSALQRVEDGGSSDAAG